MNETQQFEKWLNEGIEKRWVTPMFCETHDLTPLTKEEWEQKQEGYDFCLHMLRVVIFEDEKQFDFEG